MNLEFSDDPKFVQHSARDFLAKNAGLDVCRKVLESPTASSDPALWKGVAEMGWLGAAVPESYGGAGLGYLELVLIAQELGRALAPIPVSSSIYLCAEAILQAGSEELTVRREGEAADHLGMPGQGVKACPVERAPHADLSILAAGGEPRSVRRDAGHVETLVYRRGKPPDRTVGDRQQAEVRLRQGA